MTDNRTSSIHLVGSIPLADAAEVFEAVSNAIGGQVDRIPDGETGERTNWIAWQLPRLANNPGMEPDPASEIPRKQGAADGLAVDEPEFRFLRVKADTTADELHIETEYAHHAVESFSVFDAMQEAGSIAAGTRFQVCLPTPYAVASLYVSPDSWPTFLPAYERSLVGELTTIIDAVPADRLAIQWDVAMEVIACEGLVATPGDSAVEFTIDEVSRLCDLVAPEIDVGVHLCYGDPGHKHLVEPTDAAILTELANGIGAAVHSRLDWIHMPVPIERDDDAYFAPLAQLDVNDETDVFLGLVHMTDGLKGAQRRMAAASKVLDAYGIATECGFGRRPSDTVRPLLELHKAAAVRSSGPNSGGRGAS